MEAIVFCVILYFAAKQAASSTKAAWGKSRKAYAARASAAGRKPGGMLRHDLGYAAAQLRHGFPGARHGFAQGWHEARQAHAEAHAGREKAKTERAESLAGLIEEVRQYRERQAQAGERARTSAAGGTPEGSGQGTPEGSTSPGPEKVIQGTAEDVPDEFGSDEAHARAANYAHQQECEHPAADCQVCGLPVNGVESGDPAHQRCLDANGREQQPASPQNTGGTQMSDTTYGSVATDMTSEVASAENRAAEVNAARVAAEAQSAEAAEAKKRALLISEDMQALDMDPVTLGAIADHIDATDEADKAHLEAEEALGRAHAASLRVMETAQNVQATMAQGHAGLAAAHQEAPVEAADKAFYAE